MEYIILFSGSFKLVFLFLFSSHHTWFHSADGSRCLQREKMVWEVRHHGLLILLVMKDGAAVLGGFMAWACPGNETGVEGCGSGHGTARGLDMRLLFFSVQNAAFLRKIPSLQSLCSVLEKSSCLEWLFLWISFFTEINWWWWWEKDSLVYVEKNLIFGDNSLEIDALPCVWVLIFLASAMMADKVFCLKFHRITYIFNL